MPKKIIRPCVSLMALCLLILINNTVFAHTVTIENSGESRYKSIRLTPEIYNHANSNLSDLRLKDDNGEDVPYFLWGGFTINFEQNVESNPMSLINAYTKDDDFFFDYKLSRIPDSDIIATSIKFYTKNTGFAKNVAIYGGYDNKNWDFIRNDTVYHVDGKQKLEISFETEQKFTHYRIRLDNNLEKIAFTDVQLMCSKATKSEMYFSGMLEPEFSVETKDKKTYVTIEGTKNLHPDFVTIETDSMFKRTVSTSLGVSKELYNLSFGETNYSDTTIAFDKNIRMDDKLIVTIYNGDDKPIRINKITMAYCADDLIFEDTKSASYTLYFGADDTKTAPVYDMVRYRDEILKGNIDRLEIKEVTFDKSAGTPGLYDNKMIFNVAVIVVAIILGCLILLKLRKKT